LPTTENYFNTSSVIFDKWQIKSGISFNIKGTCVP